MFKVAVSNTIHEGIGEEIIVTPIWMMDHHEVKPAAKMQQLSLRDDGDGIVSGFSVVEAE